MVIDQIYPPVYVGLWKERRDRAYEKAGHMGEFAHCHKCNQKYEVLAGSVVDRYTCFFCKRKA
jgi:hypothetical protein